MSARKTVLVGTGNANKMREIMGIVREGLDPANTHWLEGCEGEAFAFGDGWVMKRVDVGEDILEVQGDVRQVALRKVEDVCSALDPDRLQSAWGVLVEDTSLAMNALSSEKCKFPGVYIKHAMDGLGDRNLHLLLAAFDDKRAETHCSLGWHCCATNAHDVDSDSAHGIIVSPRGDQPHAFGWDAFFEMRITPGQTLAEISEHDKYTKTARARAVLTWVRKHLFTGSNRGPVTV